MLWYTKRCNSWIVENRKTKPNGESYKVDYEYPWAEVYELIEDEDGTKTVLLCECKLFDKIDKLRGEAYKRGEWDFKIDLNL